MVIKKSNMNVVEQELIAEALIDIKDIATKILLKHILDKEIDESDVSDLSHVVDLIGAIKQIMLNVKIS